MANILYLIRHGRTSLNQSNSFRGNVNVPLEEVGKQDAEEAAEFLKDSDPAFMVSSDKKRAVQTADVFEKKFHIENLPTDALRAWNIGDFSGKPRDEENVKQVNYYAENPDMEVPGGESLNDFRGRVAPALYECFEHALKNGVGFIICHSSIIHELGNLLSGSHTSLLVEPGGIVSVGLEDGKVIAHKLLKPANKPATHAETIS